MSGIMMQLLGAAGGGANYFLSVIETPAHANNQNTMHGVVDSSDNIYVDFDYKDGSGNEYMGLVKYKPSGDVALQRRLNNCRYRAGTPDDLFDSPWPSLFDSSDNYYLSAYSTQNSNPCFLKLNSSNLTITSKYEKEFNTGAEYGGFWDTSGNFYLTGSTGFSGDGHVAKFNSSGTQQWCTNMTVTGVSGGPGVYWTGGGVDSSGNVYVCGTQPAFGYRGIIAKYNSSGTHQWSRWLNEGSNNNSFKIVKCDSSGNPYVAGTMGSSGGKTLAYIAKFNSSGTFQWDYVHCKVGDEGSGGFQSIDFDSSGNVYVAGSVREDKYPNGAFWGSYRNYGAFVKLNSSGTVQWQRGLSHTNATSGQVNNHTFSTIALDSNDDMILTSTQAKSSANVRHYVARLPSDGSLTGSYGSVSMKYGATDLGDKNVGSVGTPSSYSSSRSTTNITSNITDTSDTYTISTQVA